MPENPRTKTVSKTGNSLTVVIPSKFAQQLGIQPGDKVILKLKPQSGKIIYTFPNIRQLPLV